MRRVHALPPALCLALALGCVGADEAGEGKGGAADDGGAGEGAADATDDGASPPDCLAAPLDCDLADNDCDGTTDEGGEEELRVLSGTDRDGDGWAEGAVTRACPEPEAAAGLIGGGDCDDRDAAIHPGALEACLSAGDEDCDGLDTCEDADCAAAAACLEDCDDGVDNNADGETDCEDVGCAMQLPCWTGLSLTAAGGADLRLRLSTWRSMFGSTRSHIRQSVTLDALDLSGQARSPGGGMVPCAARATVLQVSGRFTYLRTPGGSDRSSWRDGLAPDAVAAVDGPCPAPTEADLRGLGLWMLPAVAPWLIHGADTDGVGNLRVLRGRAASWQLVPAGVSLGPARSSSRTGGSALIPSPDHPSWGTYTAWSRSQTARAESMVVVGP